MSPSNSLASPVSIGVDTGGTHTDLVLAQAGRLVTLKVPSTPHDLSLGIIDGVKRICERAGVPLSSVGRFVYASTFVTNLFVEGKAGRIGLLTTQGFRDVLEIGRASRKPDVYDIHWRPARPIVPRQLRFGVRERMSARGEVIEALDEASAREAIAAMAHAGVDCIAICLLHAYANPAHERRLADIAAELCPEVEVSLSSEVVREFREYERTSTTCISAFIRRPIRAHLDGLKEALRAQSVPASPFIMRGNGGLSTFDASLRSPVAVTHSGVMGGIIGATALAASCGISDLITLDMGGTSADVSLVSGGVPVLTHRSRIGAHPLLAPTLDMVTIGAGGGSVAWVDGGVALRVGPHSAGSVPGPACYGQGGTAPTVTDANLVAGRLDSEYFLGGARALRADLAREAIGRVARPLGMTDEATALGILAIAEAHMVNAIRLVSVERGLDPRDFTLVAFGGAGALHAVSLAQALSIRKVLIPPAPGNLSAMGLPCADVRHDHARTLFARLGPELLPRLEALYDELIDEATASLDQDGIDIPARRVLLSADLRYEGQNYELNLPVSGAQLASEFAELSARFNAQHQRVYGYQLAGREVQVVNLRVTALGTTQKARWPDHPHRAEDARPQGVRSVLTADGQRVEAAVWRFDALGPGQRFAGPAVLDYSGATLYLPPGWVARLDAMMNAHVAPASDADSPDGGAAGRAQGETA